MCESFHGTSYYPEHGGSKCLRNIGIIYQTMLYVIPQDCNLKLYLFRGGQVIGRLVRMVKVNQVVPLRC
jgi:hypothetical protein